MIVKIIKRCNSTYAKASVDEGHSGTEAQRHKGTEAQRHRGTKAQRHIGTKV